MEMKRAIEICKNIYSNEYSEKEKDTAIKMISDHWAKAFNKITKGELLRIIEYQMDILGM